MPQELLDCKCKKDAGWDLRLGSETEGVCVAAEKVSLVATASAYFRTSVAFEALFNERREQETTPSQ